MATPDQIMKFIKDHPDMEGPLTEMMKDPVKLANIKRAPSLNDQDPHKLQSVLYESISVCAVCGKEQKTFTLGKAAVTQHICLPCQNYLGNLSPDKQAIALNAGLKKDFLGQAKARFGAQQKFFEKQRKEAAKKKPKFSVTGGPVAGDADEAEDY